MPEEVAYPYLFLDEVLRAEFQSLRLDGADVDLATVADDSRHAVTLTALQGWKVASLVVRAKASANELTQVVLPSETPERALRIVAVVRGGEGRYRNATDLAVVAPGAWESELELPSRSHRGLVTVEVLAVRRSSLPSSAVIPGIASRAGERVASADRLSIYLDDVGDLPGGAIENEWRNFATDPVAELRDRKDCAWYLDMSNADRPRLLLNQGVEGLRAALEVSSTHGKAARVRDAIAHSIIGPVLITMGMSAVAHQAGDSSSDEGSWQHKLLVALARKSGTETEEKTLSRWLEQWTFGQQDVVMTDLATMIQRHLGHARGLSALTKAVGESSDA